MKRVIGITGGIASGKSTVSHYLINQGYKLVDCDKLTASSYLDCFEEIKKAFPDCIINNEISRPLLAKCVFSDEIQKEKLESIIHPYVRNKMQEVVDSTRDGLVFLDIPLLFEARMEDLCDEIWVVYVPKQLQLTRLMSRNQMDEKTALMRIHSQMDLDKKKQKADIVIDNSKDLDYLYQQVKKRLEELNDEKFIKPR